jgi:hypothetical protein
VHDVAYLAPFISTDPLKVVKQVNRVVVEYAREFVWGRDDSQYRFVCNRMSSSPDRQILTGEQKQRAIDAARSHTDCNN